MNSQLYYFINVVPSNGHGPRQDDDKSQEKRIPSQGIFSHYTEM